MKQKEVISFQQFLQRFPSGLDLQLFFNFAHKILKLCRKFQNDLPQHNKSSDPKNPDNVLSLHPLDLCVEIREEATEPSQAVTQEENVISENQFSPRKYKLKSYRSSKNPLSSSFRSLSPSQTGQSLQQTILFVFSFF